MSFLLVTPIITKYGTKSILKYHAMNMSHLIKR